MLGINMHVGNIALAEVLVPFFAIVVDESGLVGVRAEPWSLSRLASWRHVRVPCLGFGMALIIVSLIMHFRFVCTSCTSCPAGKTRIFLVGIRGFTNVELTVHMLGFMEYVVSWWRFVGRGCSKS